jgi:hypothetical protein
MGGEQVEQHPVVQADRLGREVRHLLGEQREQPVGFRGDGWQRDEQDRRSGTGPRVAVPAERAENLADPRPLLGAGDLLGGRRERQMAEHRAERLGDRQRFRLFRYQV